MIIRLRFGQGLPVGKHKGKNRHIALAANAILLPMAVMFYVLGVWCLASDLNLTRPFTVTGVLSHWQVSMLVGAALHYAARRLMRYGSRVSGKSLTAETQNSTT
ncbi:MAG: hypothetical protein ABI824_17420 [Acidobacteriota bacterium]